MTKRSKGLFHDLVERVDGPPMLDLPPALTDLTPSSGLPALAENLARLIARGQDIEEAAASLGVSSEVASLWMHSEAWVPLVKRFYVSEDFVEGELKRLVPAALAVKEKLLRDTEVAPQLRNTIADDILDRAGHKTVASRTVNVFVFSPERIAHVRDSLLKNSATVVDAEVSDE